MNANMIYLKKLYIRWLPVAFCLNTIGAIVIYTGNLDTISSKCLDNKYIRLFHSVNDKDLVVNIISGFVYPLTFRSLNPSKLL